MCVTINFNLNLFNDYNSAGAASVLTIIVAVLIVVLLLRTSVRFFASPVSGERTENHQCCSKNPIPEENDDFQRRIIGHSEDYNQASMFSCAGEGMDYKVKFW